MIKFIKEFIRIHILKRPIKEIFEAFTYEKLHNIKRVIDEKKKYIEIYQSDLGRLIESMEFYEFQINEAIKSKKDSFDRDKFRVRRNK